MNIIKREFKMGLKPFILWVLGLFFLVFVGMMKYTGIGTGANSSDFTALMDKFPKVVLALLGASGVDLTTLGGFYSVLAFYVLICAVIYAISLGNNAVSRELTDKTYEFLFTKPRSRSYILSSKLIAGEIFLMIFCFLNYIFSVMAISNLNFSGNIQIQIVLFTISIFLVSNIFYTLSAFLSAAMKHSEKSSLYSNLCFLFVFILGIVYDMMENAKILKFFVPVKYFTAKEILNKHMGVTYIIICLLVSQILWYGTFYKFKRKDLMSK